MATIKIEVPFSTPYSVDNLRAAYRYMETVFSGNKSRIDTERWLAYGMVVNVLATLQGHVTSLEGMNDKAALLYAIGCLRDADGSPIERAIYASAIEDIKILASSQFCVYLD